MPTTRAVLKMIINVPGQDPVAGLATTIARAVIHGLAHDERRPVYERRPVFEVANRIAANDRAAARLGTALCTAIADGLRNTGFSAPPRADIETLFDNPKGT